MTIKIFDIGVADIWSALFYFIVVIILCGGLISMAIRWRQASCDNSEILFLRQKINELTQSPA
jgi:hypothetical protein